jgi:hypothetical protein
MAETRESFGFLDNPPVPELNSRAVPEVAKSCAVELGRLNASKIRLGGGHRG